MIFFYFVTLLKFPYVPAYRNKQSGHVADVCSGSGVELAIRQMGQKTKIHIQSVGPLPEYTLYSDLGYTENDK